MTGMAHLQHRPARWPERDSWCREDWRRFGAELAAAERAAAVAEGGFAFAFQEGSLVQALRRGAWLLLDEINLAPPEVGFWVGRPGHA